MPQGLPNRYTVKTLVRIGLVVVISLTVLLVLSALLLGSQMSGQLGWTNHTHRVRTSLSGLERNALQAESGLRWFLYTGEENRTKELQLVQGLAGQVDQLQQEVSDNPQQTERVAELRRLVEAKVSFMARCRQFKSSSQEVELRRLLATNEGVSLARDIHNKVMEIDAIEASLLQQRRASVTRSQDGLNLLLLFGMGVELLVGLSILAFLGRRLAPLSAAAALAERIGLGDLSAVSLEVGVYDEVGRVNSSLNRMLENLKGASYESQSNADTVHKAAARLATSTREQAAALQGQSTALQQTSVTLEELSQSANQIADRSREVASRAEATAEAAKVGLDAVRKSARSTADLVDQVHTVAERVHALSGKTDAIRSIVLAVNDIAERSNVLALNAAVLAAGASSEGKGFTTVASEMKSLAEQSKEATIQVRELLGQIEQGIQAAVVFIEEAGRRGAAGSTFTDEASVAIHQLNAQVHDGSLAFSQITAATSQQKLAFEQVSEALLSIREASQQSTTATLGLEKTTQELYQLSTEFVKSIRHRT